MTGPLWLRDEDRPDYARAVDQAIRSPQAQRLIRRSTLRTGQVRVRALDAGPRIASMASAEYESYMTLRRQAREEAGRSELVSLSGRRDQEAPCRPSCVPGAHAAHRLVDGGLHAR